MDNTKLLNYYFIYKLLNDNKIKEFHFDIKYIYKLIYILNKYIKGYTMDISSNINIFL